MAIYRPKYRMTYGNISGDNFELIIEERGLPFGEVIPMEGYCTLSNKSVDDFFTAVRGASLEIDFLATLEQPFEQFNVIQEFQLLAKFYRNGNEIFRGWINPDGVSQSYVVDKWNVRLVAVDGLAFLKNYEFDAKEIAPQEFNYLYCILERLNLDLPLATFDDINNLFLPNGTPLTYDLTSQLRRILNDKVFRNKNGRFLDCQTILNDILQKYNFTLSQQNINGNLVWLIARTPFVVSATTQRGIVWRLDGINETTGVPTWARNGTFERPTSLIGSQSQASEVVFDAIHCNENQEISYAPALQNFRFEQKWLGFLNKGFESFNNTNYDLESNSEFIDGELKTFSTTSNILGATQLLPIQLYHLRPLHFNINFNYTIFGGSNLNQGQASYQCVIRAVNVAASNIYYLKRIDGENQWTDEFTIYRLPIVTIESTFNAVTNVSANIETPEINNVDLYIDIYRPRRVGIVTFPFTITTHSIEVFFDDPLLGLGEYHDCTRNNFSSSYLKEPVKVINSNENNNLFLNNLYQSNLTVITPQNSWQKGNAGTLYSDLLELTSRERIDLMQRPQMIFRGDVYGFVPYWGVVAYHLLEGTFLITDYKYNTRDNIITIESRQYFTAIVPKNYEKSYIFDDERNVLIKG